VFVTIGPTSKFMKSFLTNPGMKTANRVSSLTNKTDFLRKNLKMLPCQHCRPRLLVGSRICAGLISIKSL
jgi:hypothetical protein